MELISGESILALFKNIPAGVVILNRNFQLIWFNEIYSGYISKYFSSVPEKVMGMSYFDFAPGSKDQLKPIFEKVISTGETFKARSFPLLLTNEDNQESNTFWDVTIMRVVDRMTKNPDGICIIAIDTTEQIKAKNLYSNSDVKYKILIENMNDGIIVVDKNEIVQFVNQKMCDIFGYSFPSEIIGKSILSFVDEKNKEILIKKSENRKNGLSETYELEIISQWGNRIPVSFSASPLINERGEYLGSFAVVSDLSKKKELDDLKIRTEKLDTINQMVISLNHEINNPLTSIVLNLELLKKERDLSSNLRKYVDLIENNVNRIANVVQKIQNLADVKIKEYTDSHLKMIDLNGES